MMVQPTFFEELRCASEEGVAHAELNAINTETNKQYCHFIHIDIVPRTLLKSLKNDNIATLFVTK